MQSSSALFIANYIMKNGYIFDSYTALNSIHMMLGLKWI